MGDLVPATILHKAKIRILELKAMCQMCQGNWREREEEGEVVVLRLKRV